MTYLTQHLLINKLDKVRSNFKSEKKRAELSQFKILKAKL